MEEEENKSPET